MVTIEQPGVITDDEISVLLKYSSLTNMFLPIIREYFPKAKINTEHHNRECLPVICIDKDRFEDEADFSISVKQDIWEKNRFDYHLMIDDIEYADYIVYSAPIDTFITDLRAFLSKFKEDMQNAKNAKYSEN